MSESTADAAVQAVQRGGSGAEIIFLDDGDVLKHGDERVGRQGAWLASRPYDSLPHVRRQTITETSYVMERLEPLTLNDEKIDHFFVMQAVIKALATDIWRWSAHFPRFDPAAHLQRWRPLRLNDFRRNRADPTILTTQSMLYSRIAWDDLHTCLTHGDPIFDNVMYRSDDVSMLYPVLADPIPGGLDIPNVLAVDVARLVQSALGYERVRYDLRWPSDLDMTSVVECAYDMARVRLTRNEWNAVRYFTLMHLMRASSDAKSTDDIAAKLRPLALYAIEGVTWTR